MNKIQVGLLGATGMVGQQYLMMLADHPWFELVFLAGSENSQGKTYGEAVEGRWHMQAPIPSQFRKRQVHGIDQIDQAKKCCSFVFSAVHNDAAKIYEALYAAAGLPVISNAGYHRMSSDVPMLIPEVNPSHVEIIAHQQKNRGWEKGFIAVKPNCSLQSYMIPLAPLHEQFCVTKILVTTLQAVSGSGYPGVASLDIVDNIVPHILGEEEKSEKEPLKIWGSVAANAIVPANNIAISAHCNRVPVIDGHLACVSVKFERTPTKEQILEIWDNYPRLGLPSSPEKTIIYREECDRPQPRKDRTSGNGMSVTVGRLRPCPLFDFRFVGLSHNTIRGAAGGGILNAEFLHTRGYL